MLTGSCLCGAVAFEIEGPARPVTACHCGQCRKVSGHFWASTEVPRDRMRLTAETGLAWYRSSDFARRGFCSRCGATLFWEMDGDDRISVSGGALEAPTGLTLEKHIFTRWKGDYYEIGADGLPHLDEY
ncbi:GFA family protein [Rhodovulum sp. YNF3179]|uniref:GFA family protein n=1 Tax=Rhodovulum sp. YNF3179 TaxID=3425127 RepID=UPI003D34F063